MVLLFLQVSGTRFWGYFKEKCEKPENFFASCFVYNLCPLAFMNGTGKNITPPQLPSLVRNKLNSTCEQAFINIIKLLRVEIIVAVGRYAKVRAENALKGSQLKGSVRVESILHPSPANPAANKGWKDIIDQQLLQIGIRTTIQCDAIQ
jgi:single-strand selective monofunctional uracil DNA glycosylase